jgi:hypothetical protein
MVVTKSARQVPKLDLRKLHKELYSPSAKEVVVVEVPEFQFLWLDGRIEAGRSPSDSGSFRDAMGAMYGVAYGLKFMSKLRDEDPVDFTVMAIEGLWSTESGGFPIEPTESLVYCLLMMQPDHITPSMFERVVAQAAAKRPNPALSQIRLERWREGLAMQIMHIGAYADEPATIARMDSFAEANGYEQCGRHHEIYLGDPTRAKPENLRTILRRPIRRVGS